MFEQAATTFLSSIKNKLGPEGLQKLMMMTPEQQQQFANYIQQQQLHRAQQRQQQAAAAQQQQQRQQQQQQQTQQMKLAPQHGVAAAATKSTPLLAPQTLQQLPHQALQQQQQFAAKQQLLLQQRLQKEQLLRRQQEMKKRASFKNKAPAKSASRPVTAPRATAGHKRRSESVEVEEISTNNPIALVEEISKQFPVEVEFVKPTEEMIQGYTVDVCRAARAGDAETLKKLHSEGSNLQCCNRFGESLIHMVCRRGDMDLVKFLLEEASVTLRMKDDYGRTPLHDACWTSKPRFELAKYILEKEPGLLYVKDVRGHSPLNYIRKEHYNDWYIFLQENKGILEVASKAMKTD